MKQVRGEHPVIRILFLGANPSRATRLALDQEVREIVQRLRATPQANRFEFIQEWAVRPGDLQAALLRHTPTIIHFSGHGLGQSQRDAGEVKRDVEIPDAIPGTTLTGGAILFEDGRGGSAPVGADALADLLRIVGNVRCIVLNACFSAEQSDALRRQVDCVIGMADSILDTAAIAFAWAFYQAVGFGQPIRKAFDLGCNQIALEGLAGKDIPCALAREGTTLEDTHLLAVPESPPTASTQDTPPERTARPDLIDEAKQPPTHSGRGLRPERANGRRRVLDIAGAVLFAGLALAAFIVSRWLAPALVGLGSFLVYMRFGPSRIGGGIVKSIVDKLRKDPHVDIEKYTNLTPSKIEKLLQSDASIRAAVNDQDLRLLHTIVVLQYIMTITVVVIAAALVMWSGWLMIRPKPLAISLDAPRAVSPDAKGVLVDLDPLRVQWTLNSGSGMIAVSLENVDSHERTPPKQVDSNVRSVEFTSNEIMPIATRRGYKKKNRIRVVAEWPGKTVFSEATDLEVGITAHLNLFGRLLGADGTDRTIHTLFATIDESTETMPSKYCFSVNFVYYTDVGPSITPLRSCHDQGEVTIPNLERIRWDRPYGLTYNGPDDSRIVRTRVSGAPAE